VAEGRPAELTFKNQKGKSRSRTAAAQDGSGSAAHQDKRAGYRQSNSYGVAAPSTRMPCLGGPRQGGEVSAGQQRLGRIEEPQYYACVHPRRNKRSRYAMVLRALRRTDHGLGRPLFRPVARTNSPGSPSPCGGTGARWRHPRHDGRSSA
jgi:hypothetical protein